MYKKGSQILGFVLQGTYVMGLNYYGFHRMDE